MEMQEDRNQVPIIEIKQEEVILVEIKPDVNSLDETKYPIEITPGHDESDLIEITPEHDESQINVIPEFQVHVAVKSENENIEFKPDINDHVESILEQQGPVEIHECIETEENHQQIEVKTEYEFIPANVEEAIEKDQVNNINIMEHNNEVSYKVCNISRCLKMFVHAKLKQSSSSDVYPHFSTFLLFLIKC